MVRLSRRRCWRWRSITRWCCCGRSSGDAYLLCELTVEEDYPQRITEFSQRVMGEEE